MRIKQLNPLKRKLLRPFRNLLTSDIEQQSKALTQLPQSILITRLNHRLGNQLLITPLIEDLIAHFPNCSIDLVVQGQMAEQINRANPNVADYIVMPRKPFKELGVYLKTWLKIRRKKYDLAINVTASSTSGRLAAKLSKSKLQLMGDEFQQQYAETPLAQHLAVQPVYNLRAWLASVNWAKNIPLPSLKLHLTAAEKAHGVDLIKKLNPTHKQRVVALYTFATDIKCYEPRFWQPVYEQLKANHPDIHFIEILPVENISQLTDPELIQFYSKDIREIAALMQQCELIVVADSGMMHLATASQTPTLGLFKNPYHHKYTPYGGKNGSLLVRDHEPEVLVNYLAKHLGQENSQK